MISRGYRQVAPPSFCSLVQIHLGWEEYPAFATRDLSEYRVAYLFADGIAERLHRASPGRRCCAPGYFVLPATHPEYVRLIYVTVTLLVPTDAESVRSWQD